MIIKVRKFTKIIGLATLTSLSGLLEAQLPWSPAGPLYTAGRARNMIVDKNDASGNTLYIGSTSSGVFKSTNGGQLWSALDDQGLTRNISYMAQSPDGTIYAGTGEGYLRAGQKAKALPGTGLYKLVNDQLTLVTSSAITGTVINRVAVSPVNSNMIVVTTNKGVLVSNNGGSSFSPAPGVTFTTGLSGQDAKFDSNGILYCSIGSEIGNASTASLTPSMIYKSSDAGLTNFIAITPTSSVLSDKYYGRIELAVAPSDNNVIYASCANKNTDGKSTSSASLKGLFVSYDAGQTWALLLQGASQLDPLTNGATVATGDYAGALLVNPSNKHQLFFGGFAMYIFTRTVGAGNDSDTNPIGNWVRVGHHLTINSPYYLHENIHDIKIVAGNPTRFYFVTDAGVYRSTDMTSANQNIPPSFQPFYKGLVTGQFNSVSIQRFPIGTNVGSTTGGTKITPDVGFVGGTGGNGLTFYSGTAQDVTQESSYIGGDVYNAEFSKILPNAAFATIANGNMFRSSDIKNGSSIAAYSVNKYGGELAKIAPTAETFVNAGITTGTPFKMWEYYGQFPNANNPDKILFYNDSLRSFSSVPTVSDMATTANFTVGFNRPDNNRAALMDSIVVRTATVALAQVANPPAFTTGKTIYIALPTNYSTSGSVTVLSGSQLTVTGDASTSSQPTITLNHNTVNDVVNVTFAAPPFGDKTVSTTNPGHYRVFVTVFYRYKAGDTITVVDKNISTKNNSYTTRFTSDVNWRFTPSSAPSYSINAAPNAAVTNPTYQLVPGAAQPTSSLPIVVRQVGVRTYSLYQLGTYTMSAKPVDYTLSVNTDTNLPGTTYTFVLTPGALSQTAAATSTQAVSFVVTPTATTDYTITQMGSTTLTSVSTISVGASSYVLNPGNVTQSTPVFSVLINAPATPSSYTINGVSSNTLLGNNTTTTTANYPVRTSATVGSTVVPFAPNNAPVKIPLRESARLAAIANNGALTGNADAIVVSRNPLALNDPGIFVRVSQSGCKTDDASGNPSENTIQIDGKPTMLEWSKSGTEIYFATDQNKLYRVSHITDLYDLSPAFYNGKFYTDVFNYVSNGPSGSGLNPASPYRTTLIGAFDVPITSISVSNDDTKLAVTFNNPAQTGTTGIVMYSGNNVKTSGSHAATGWTKKDNGLAGRTTYCSMTEKNNSNMVFVGTESGLYYTTDITSGTWKNASNTQPGGSNQLPNVQVFDIKQQVMAPWECYNSGQIYVATNGRGVWINSDFFTNYYVGVDENPVKTSEFSGLKIFPNPTSGNFNVSLEGMSGGDVMVKVYDLSGREVRSANVDLSASENYTVDISGMNTGIYIVTASSDAGSRKVAKLILTK